MKYIPLRNRDKEVVDYAKVDDHLFDVLNEFTWHKSIMAGNTYVVTSQYSDQRYTRPCDGYNVGLPKKASGGMIYAHIFLPGRAKKTNELTNIKNYYIHEHKGIYYKINNKKELEHFNNYIKKQL